jgi:Uma2 family endonuclease
MDVVLDRNAGLIVQPDLMFISNERASIIQNHIWGAPDLVIEVASPNTEYRDRTIKLEWYQKYGVRECWLVHDRERRIHIVDCARSTEAWFAGVQTMRSRVFEELMVKAGECFP